MARFQATLGDQLAAMADNAKSARTAVMGVDPLTLITAELLAANAVSKDKLDAQVQAELEAAAQTTAVQAEMAAEATERDSRLATAETDLVASKGRLDQAEADLVAVFGEAGAAQSTADAANTSATAAQTRADSAAASATAAQSAADFALAEAKKSNLIVNGDWEGEPVAGQHSSYADYRFASASARSGSYVGRIKSDGWRTVVYNKVPVRPGQVLEVRYWHRKDGTPDASANWAVGFDRFGADGVDLGMDMYPTYSARPTDSTSWQETVGRVTVPSDTFFATMRTTYSASTYTGTGHGQVDDVWLGDASAMTAAATAQAAADAAKADAAAAQSAANAAQSTANTAKTNAATAQTQADTAVANAADAQGAADAAQAKADTAAEAAITGDAYSLNPSFDDWTGTYPALFTNYNTGPTKSTSTVKRGNVSARFNVDVVPAGLNFNGILNHAPNLEYWTVEVQFYLAAGTSLSGAGVLLDWVGLANNRVHLLLMNEFPNPQTGKWYTLVKTVRRPTNATGTFTAMDGYLMANYNGGLGSYATKDIYYDWLNIRPASVEEIQSYGAPSLITAAQNAADTAQAAADLAKTNAATAQSRADSAHSLAGTAESNAQSAITSASNANANALQAKVATIPSDRSPTGAGKWLVTTVTPPVAPPNKVAPTLDYFATVVPSEQSVVSDGANLVKDIGTNYYGSLRTNIRASANMTLAFTALHDDGGAVFLDGVEVYRSDSYKTGASISFPVTAGWHVLDLTWTENTGGDGWSSISPTIGSQVAELVAPSTAADATAQAVAARTAADNVSKNLFSTAAPSGVAPYGSTWFQVNGTGEVTGQWQQSASGIASTWTSRPIRSEVIANLDVGKLSAGTANLVTAVAQKIAAGTANFQTADIANLFTTSATMSSAVAQEIYAAKLSASKIYANEVLIGTSGNLIPNGRGELGDNSSGWSSKLVMDTVEVPPGLPFSVRPASATTATIAMAYEYWPVEPDTDYTFEIWLKASKPNSRMYLELRDQDGNHGTTNSAIPGEVNTTYSTGYPVGNYTLLTTWTRHRVRTRTNSTARKLRIGNFYTNHVNGSERTAIQYIGGVALMRATEGALLVDGAIDGKTVTGATIRTAASGARIVMDSSGLNGWDANNVNYLKADSTGITVTGTLTASQTVGSTTVDMVVGGAAARKGVVTQQVPPPAPTGGSPVPGMVFKPAGVSMYDWAGISADDGKTLKLSSGMTSAETTASTWPPSSVTLKQTAAEFTKPVDAPGFSVAGSALDFLPRHAEFYNNGFATAPGSAWDIGPLTMDTNSSLNVNNNFAVVHTVSGSVKITKAGFYSFTLLVGGYTGNGWVSLRNGNGTNYGAANTHGYSGDLSVNSGPVWVAANEFVRGHVATANGNTVSSRLRVHRINY